MKKILLISMVAFLFAGCDYIAPQIEKSRTEKRQEELLKEQNELLRQQNLQLRRIADAIVALEAGQRRPNE